MKDNILPLIKWLLHCLNPDCSAHTERYGNEPDVICSRCGSKLEIIEKLEETK